MKDGFCNQDGQDLKELFTSQIENIRVLIDANDKNYNQRFENVIQATSAALAASDRAVNKAEGAAEKRFEGLNELRGMALDQQRVYIPRAEVEILIKGINEKIDTLNITTITRQGKSIGQEQGVGYVVGIASIVSVIIAIASRFIK